VQNVLTGDAKRMQIESIFNIRFYPSICTYTNKILKMITFLTRYQQRNPSPRLTSR